MSMEKAQAMRRRLDAVDVVTERTGLHPEEVEECYRVADRVRANGGRMPFAIDGSDLFGIMGCLPALLDAIARLAATPLSEGEAPTVDDLTAYITVAVIEWTSAEDDIGSLAPFIARSIHPRLLSSPPPGDKENPDG